ncbi:peptide deformylase [Leeuwenhoekiella marinoflava]|uniref:Peptide deformylase n=2 Tax=Leeuwenhoekiella marinoflava TaxID=988 RepID=A0A4Q0PQ90_9FLAO|nr:peptide deformylase [Leeuwenhoekiella marinoflava]RXG32664.1 peptide deformylase [Leeuwenhoekiella marinoflava]SHE52634.1 peptide deformylase [Leeuwenhoekiella marinoflava DSM 3653]
MILPIVAYGDPVLRKKAAPITQDYPKLDELIANMFETMYGASGVGLAAPQIGKAIRIFVVDATPFADDEDLSEKEQAQLKTFKKAFINPEIIEETGDEWAFSEGCLSIPGINEDVFRCPNIKIKYQDQDFKEHIEEYDGLLARVIQHEYDHIEGILFTDKLSSLKKRIIKSKLAGISKGKTNADYRMRFPDKKGR